MVQSVWKREFPDRRQNRLCRAPLGHTGPCSPLAELLGFPSRPALASLDKSSRRVSSSWSHTLSTPEPNRHCIQCTCGFARTHSQVLTTNFLGHFLGLWLCIRQWGLLWRMVLGEKPHGLWVPFGVLSLMERGKSGLTRTWFPYVTVYSPQGERR